MSLWGPRTILGRSTAGPWRPPQPQPNRRNTAARGAKQNSKWWKRLGSYRLGVMGKKVGLALKFEDCYPVLRFAPSSWDLGIIGLLLKRRPWGIGESVLWTDYLWSLKILMLKMDLEIIIVSEVSQRKKNTMWYHLHVESKTWHKWTNLWNIQTHREQTCGCQGKGGWIGGLGLRCKLLTHK